MKIRPFCFFINECRFLREVRSKIVLFWYDTDSFFIRVFFMQQLPFKAVVSDLDGTLLNANHVIGDFTIEILNKLEQKGVDIILATGRNHTDVSSILGKIGAEHAVMITSNGARVRDLKVILFIVIVFQKKSCLSCIKSLLIVPRFVSILIKMMVGLSI